ncbi:hypothetical protein Ppb6_01897 [Photorhabdus australis subsp. thailandensis]|uniref:Uncharacterized protein n=1 Tax=Photorhabdus australis subsp. thailandensis TaxID=2805096 RepID=A0A1C0U4P4_9GAMM|nr:hypothetical protein Ppb6_01897 [Photorhabdus australis subsp. thailandensis]
MKTESEPSAIWRMPFSLLHSTGLRVAIAAGLLLIATLGEPSLISPQGLRDEAPLDTQASRAMPPT